MGRKIMDTLDESDASGIAKSECTGRREAARQTVTFSGLEATQRSSVEGVISLFESVAEEEGWTPGDDLRTYIARSVYFCSYVEGKGLVGALQVVLPDENGELPLHKTWPDITQRRATETNVVHIALLAVRRESRHHDHIYWQLCVAMWRWCIEHDVTNLWAEMTPRNTRIYERLGWEFTIEGALHPHWGEDCYPCRLSVHGVYEIVAARAQRNSPRYRRILGDALAGKDNVRILEDTE